MDPGARTGDVIAAVARGWLGTPFIGGCWPPAKGRGCDCGGLIAGVLAEAGVLPLPAPGAYDWRAPWGRGDSLYLDLVAAKMAEISAARARAGDVVLYRMGRGWSHGAVVLEWPRAVIHATPGLGVTVQHAHGGRLARRAHRAFRPG